MKVQTMTLKSKIIILICVYLAGYVTALKLTPKPAPLEISQNNTQKAVAKKTTKKKTYAPSGQLASEEETTEDLDLFVNNKLTAKVPAQTIYKRDAVIADLDSTLRAGVLIKPYALLPLPIIPQNLYTGYAKDIRTGEDIYRLAYTVFTKE